ncbi:4'-phosphopantetheinyl transferase superfamily protein [Maribacter sp. M208]|uniref:4'-phosphopantetheinyl transferase family protein n=1 Tax=Maribacter huludaoensis TaxID=3030010 RepID=UPI0023ECDCB0|nr:4'-phosphopantetheinyl transferase superfamily protein [Maribacter huludaoensis]MDF4221065.1 4'-phosphopantetheinyl transferase superfamily protein [Maribacter huludaoensis]
MKIKHNRPSLNKVISSIYIYDDSYSQIKGYDIRKSFMEYCLLHCSNLKINNIHFAKGKYGKPYLKDVTDIHFNLSHKSGIYVFICSRHPVGIDIEKSRDNFVKPRMKPYFSEQEWSKLHSVDSNKLDFATLWSLKESYSKYHGLGLLLPFSSFTIDKFGNQYSVVGHPEIYLTHRLYKTDYNISLCSKILNKPELHIVSECDIYQQKKTIQKTKCSNLNEIIQKWCEPNNYNNNIIASNEC